MDAVWEEEAGSLSILQQLGRHVAVHEVVARDAGSGVVDLLEHSRTLVSASSNGRVVDRRAGPTDQDQALCFPDMRYASLFEVLTRFIWSAPEL